MRGDATRRLVAREAARIATIHGLDFITLGGLAAATGASKAGILTVFGTREAIQVAAVAEARLIYLETVIHPVLDTPSGQPRLLALLDTWRDYLLAGVFPGGCFISATAAEYGHRDGPVAEAVRNLKREWLDFLESELTAAGSAHPHEDAYTIDAYFTAGNQRRELFGHDEELDTAHHLAHTVIEQAARQAPYAQEPTPPRSLTPARTRPPRPG
jgi:AcrR family transcriptional regulator